MIKRTIKLFLYDVLFQFRHGFYLVYFVIGLLYIILLYSIPSSNRLYVTNILVFSDTSVLGLSFVGALLLLEKQQNILHSLFVTPVQIGEYIFAKITSLSFLSLVVSLLLLILPNGLGTSIPLFSISVLLTSSFFTLIGLGVGAKVNSLNGYIFTIMIGTFVFSFPLLAYFNIFDPFWFYILPTRASLLLLSKTFQPVKVLPVFLAITSLIIWNSLAWLYAKRQFEKFILIK